ncbi:MAG: acetolactate synthase, partial [Actinophytocola sp.]|nr:acetolactate synthase [Actinophytocola sp.]
FGPKPRRGRRHAADRPEERVTSWRTRIEAEARAEGRRWLPLLAAVDEALGRDGIFVGDRAMACYRGALANLPRYLPRTFLYPAGLGTAGYGLPAAIGASLGWPGTRVVALHGDGGFMVVAPELATAAQLGLALPVVVVDNGGYGGVREEMRRRGDSEIAVHGPPVDFCGLAVSLGCYSLRTGD